MKKTSSFVTTFLSLIVMALWGSLFPFIKIGYTAFDIDTACVPDILMFAGLRFTVCGIIITAISFFRGERMDLSLKQSIIPVLVTGLFAVVLHYAFTYIGLALTESSKTAIL